MKELFLLVLILLFCQSCFNKPVGVSSSVDAKKESSSMSTDDISEIKMLEAKEKLMAEAGGRATVLISINPLKWKEYIEEVLSFALHSEKLKILNEMINPEMIDKQSALKSALQLLFSKKIEDWNTPSGWDESRPIVAGLMEPVENNVLDILNFRDDEYKKVNVLGHRLLIPATNVSKLAVSLSAVIDSTGLKKVPSVKCDQQNVSGWVTDEKHILYSIIKRDDYIQIEIKSSIDDYFKDLKLIEKTLKDECQFPEKKDLVITPSYKAMLKTDGVVSVLGRLWLLQQLSLHFGMNGLSSSFLDVDEHSKRPFEQFGVLASTGRSLLLQTNRGTESDEFLKVFDMKNDFRELSVFSLTPLGKDAYSYLLKHKKYPKMFPENMTPDEAQQKISNIGDVTVSCGGTCYFYLGFRKVIWMASLLEANNPDSKTNELMDFSDSTYLLGNALVENSVIQKSDPLFKLPDLENISWEIPASMLNSDFSENDFLIFEILMDSYEQLESAAPDMWTTILEKAKTEILPILTRIKESGEQSVLFSKIEAILQNDIELAESSKQEFE
ncbi:MAG: hypothetical protein JXR91_05230 [Deltaproteobacteria bacterium]|nr:hypothetical protein [Deltaproteobacteria bacterium]